MGIIRFIKLILFIFECIIFLFISALLISSSIEQAGFPYITFAVSASLFPLMALFIWLDSDRYRVYIPLFTAGKCIGIFSILGWSIFAGQVRIIDVLSGGVKAKIESFLFYSYIFSMVVIFLIIRDKVLGGKNQSDEKLEVE